MALGKLEKLKICAFDNDNFTGKGVKEIQVAINPEKYSHDYQICYSKVNAPGSSAGSPKFNRTPSDKVSFELVFDGTGAIPTILPGVIPGGVTGSVADQIEEFKNVVFKVKGKIHSPYFLRLSWGTLQFECRLQQLNIQFTLFKPDGSPLRARAGAEFVGYQNEKLQNAETKKSSPDLSHIVTVKKGDILPLLCYRIYQDSSFYLQVAAVNNLVNFRNLKPGSKLLFPPITER